MTVKEQDLRPRVHYDSDGKAVKIIELWLDNGITVESGYELSKTRGYTEFSDDMETLVNGFERSWETTIERLERCTKANPHTLPAHLVLGADEETVNRIATEKNIKIVNIQSPLLN